MKRHRLLTLLLGAFCVFTAGTAQPAPAAALPPTPRVGPPLLLYSAADGRAATAVVDSRGAVSVLRRTDLGPGWSHITYAGAGRFLAYRASDGRTSVGQVDAAGNYTNE